MTTIVCLTIRSLLKKVKDVDWKGKGEELMEKIKPYAQTVGRATARPLLQFYYVMVNEATPTLDKVLIYAAIFYTISPVNLISSSLYKLLGVLDEGAAILYVYKKVKERITPEIELKVESILDEWFGARYELVE